MTTKNGGPMHLSRRRKKSVPNEYLSFSYIDSHIKFVYFLTYITLSFVNRVCCQIVKLQRKIKPVIYCKCKNTKIIAKVSRERLSYTVDSLLTDTSIRI